ncbi:hypothetical protein BHM03_00046804 [Ensete ventricosum]|nr:hypothetical protein BHM03_00046804 [Ensete ventricosum]
MPCDYCSRPHRFRWIVASPCIVISHHGIVGAVVTSMLPPCLYITFTVAPPLRTGHGRALPLLATGGIGYSPKVEEAQSGAPTGKRSHNERLSTMGTRLDVLEASLEELYQGQGRILGVESSQDEAESRIDRVEFLVD